MRPSLISETELVEHHTPTERQRPHPHVPEVLLPNWNDEDFHPSAPGS